MSKYISIAIAILVTAVLGSGIFLGTGSNSVQGSINSLMSQTTNEISELTD